MLQLSSLHGRNGVEWCKMQGQQCGQERPVSFWAGSSAGQPEQGKRGPRVGRGSAWPRNPRGGAGAIHRNARQLDQLCRLSQRLTGRKPVPSGTVGAANWHRLARMTLLSLKLEIVKLKPSIFSKFILWALAKAGTRTSRQDSEMMHLGNSALAFAAWLDTKMARTDMIWHRRGTDIQTPCIFDRWG